MQLKFLEKKKEEGDVVSFLFESEAPISWVPGQYIHYTLPHKNPDERGTERYFTISSAPFEKNIRITTRIIDKRSSFKNNLSKLSKGSVIKADPPEGDFVVKDPSKKYIFIAGGIGITPFRSILLDLDKRNLSINATLLYVNKTSEFVFKEELENLAKKYKDFKINYFVSPNRIDENTIKAILNFTDSIFYISGPAPMVFSFKDMLSKMGISGENIKLDDFPGYTWP